MPAATLAEDHTTLTRESNVDSAWEPWLPNVRYPADIPASGNAGCFHEGPFAADTTAPRWSAFADGQYYLSMMNDHRWAPLVDEDFGLAVIRALGPDGHAFKWVNL
eukprot:1020955-Pyramimonas_sp.AAC.1